MAKLDLTGEIYGRLRVIEEAPSKPRSRGSGVNRYWLCLCDPELNGCGNKIVVLQRSLTSGNTKSCGCLQKDKVQKSLKIDLTGQKIDKLLIIKEADPKIYHYKNRRPRVERQWLCQCDCGSDPIIRSQSYLRKKCKTPRSCGCAQGLSRLLPFGEVQRRIIYKEYKNAAQTRGHIFELTEEQADHIMTSNCIYCGIMPLQHRNSKYRKHNTPYLYNGIDRVDNSKGYIMGNCVPCCEDCNRRKHTMKLSDFLDWLSRFGVDTTTIKARIEWKLAVQCGEQLYPWKWDKARMIDIDGTLLTKVSPEEYEKAKAQPGAVELVNKWFNDGDYICLFTARPDTLYHFTRWQMTTLGFKFHKIIEKPYTGDVSIEIYDDKEIRAYQVDPDTGICGVDEA